MNKNRLLEFYEKSLKIELPVSESDILVINNYCNELNKTADWRIEILHRIYHNTIINLNSYRTGPIEYFKTVNGIKIIKSDCYIGVIDYWFPSEYYFFDLTRNPILSGFFVSEVLRCGKGVITDILDLNKLDCAEKDRVLNTALESFKNTLLDTEIWGFWMRNMRKADRQRGIRIRRFTIKSISLKRFSYPEHRIFATIIDQDSGEEKNLGVSDCEGWNFYLSRSLLNQKLSEIEVLWMRGYDTKVESLNSRIKKKKKELECLISERKKFMNGITEYQEKIKKILYGKTS